MPNFTAYLLSRMSTGQEGELVAPPLLDLTQYGRIHEAIICPMLSYSNGWNKYEVPSLGPLLPCQGPFL